MQFFIVSQVYPGVKRHFCICCPGLSGRTGLKGILPVTRSGRCRFFLYIVLVLLAFALIPEARGEGVVIRTPAPRTQPPATPSPPPVIHETDAPARTPLPEPTPAPTDTPLPKRTPAPADTQTAPPVIHEVDVGTRTPRPTPNITVAATPTPIPIPPPLIVNRVRYPDRWTDFALDRGAGILEVIFPPQRDCDAILLRGGGKTLLIDCASHEFDITLVNTLKYLGVKRIDQVLISHPHHDHIEGFPRLCEAFEIGELWVSFPEDYNEHMASLLAWAEYYGVPVKQYGDGDLFTVGKATLEAIIRCPEDYSCNDRSAQMMLRYGERTMLFTADIETAGMDWLTQTCAPGELRAEILKYPHHGKAKLTDAFFEAVDPLFAVVTQRERGWSGQNYLRTLHLPWVNTRAYGIRLSTDGERWLVEHVYPVGDPRGE